MRIENVVSFEQSDENQYTLTVWKRDRSQHTPIDMDTFEAVRLYQLLKATIGPYVQEMEAAKASYDRGEGPNGEAPGTWEHSRRVDHYPEPFALHEARAEFRCDDPEGAWVEEMRYQADVLNKARKENR